MKFRSILISAVGIALTQAGFAQINNAKGRIVGNGDRVEQRRRVDSFDRLLVDYAVAVRITEGDPATVELAGESNVLPYLTVETKNGQLRVGLSRQADFKEIKKVTVTIHNAKLSEIRARTACGITSELPIETDALRVTLDEACHLTAPLQVRRLQVDLSAASNVSLKGITAEANFVVDGAGRVNADELTIGQADIRLNGASAAKLHVTERLSATADGVSTLTYRGNPVVPVQKASGLSTIEKN